jgi:hypothetical protein
MLTLLGVAPTVLLEIGTDDVTAREEGAKKLSSKMTANPEILRICIRLLTATTQT